MEVGKGVCVCYWSHLGALAEGGLAWSSPRVHGGMEEVTGVWGTNGEQSGCKLESLTSEPGLVTISLS